MKDFDEAIKDDYESRSAALRDLMRQFNKKKKRS